MKKFVFIAIQFLGGWGFLIWLRYGLFHPESAGMIFVLGFWIAWLGRMEYLFSKQFTSGCLAILFGTVVGGLSGFSILFYGGLWLGIILGLVSMLVLRNLK